MRKKTKINFFGALLMMALFLSAGNSLAQESLPDSAPGGASVPEVVVLATVDIINAKMISQENGELKISFGLSNAIGVQDGVKYAVELRNIENGQLIDRKIFDEVLVLGERQTVEREVVYVVPKQLSGKFRVLLASQNEKGFSFGAMIVGDVEVQGTEKGISLDASGCFLKVSGSDESFNLTQGVDVSRDEELTLFCPASSSFEVEMEAIPSFKTNFRTAFGKTIAEEKGSPIRIGAGEKKEISLVIPKANSPQAYDAEIVLADGSGKKISNTISAHYVLQGLSGTIQNITLDKDVYDKGDAAQISFFWTGRADDFPDSRIGMSRAKTSVRILATDPEGKNCSEVFSKEVDTRFNGGKEDMKISMTEDCQGGRITVALLDDKGNVLDEKAFDFKGEKKAPAQNPVQKKNVSLLFLASMIAGAILLIGIIVILVKRSKNGGVVGAAMFFLVLSLFFSIKSAEAGSFSFPYSYWTASFTYSLSGYANIGSDGRYRFCAGDDMWMYMTGHWDGCTNTADSIMSTFYQNMANYPNGRVHPIQRTHDRDAAGWGLHRAPLASGNYQMSVAGAVFIGENFDENNSDYVSSSLYYLDYRVDNPINGQCGTPPGALCSSGDLSGPPTQIGSTMYWTCLGKTNYGCRAGSDASCSAPALVCQGTVPANATACAGDNTYVPLGTSWHYEAAGCTANKCEYVCNGGFVWNGSSCVSPSCQGNVPSNSDPCSGDNTGLSADTTRKAVTSCSSPAGSDPKCEYQCRSGFIPNAAGTDCVTPWCSPETRSGATVCPLDNTGLGGVTNSVSVLACSSPDGSSPKCQYKCTDPNACLVGEECTSPGADVYTYTCQAGVCGGENCGDSVQNSCTVTMSNNCGVVGTSFTTTADCEAHGKPCPAQTQCGPCAGNYREVEP